MSQSNNSSAYRRAKEKYDGICENASLYFENNKDLVAASEFESAMALGCFDKEFMYFVTAYQDEHGIAYRVSARELTLQRFVEHSAALGLYPTPVKRFIRRTPCPCGAENQIRQSIKRQAAQALRQVYSAAYFEALAGLAAIAPNNTAYSYLKAWQEELDGVYDQELLALYQGLLLTALEGRVLSLAGYLEITAWLEDIYRQLEDDIIPKGLYKKVLSGFAYTQQAKPWQYFYDAKPEVTYQEKALKERQGYLTTPIFSREKWLTDMAQFRQMRQDFLTDYRACCTHGYLERFQTLKNLPGPISRQAFDEQLALVRESCSPEAAEVFATYRSKWNIQ